MTIEQKLFEGSLRPATIFHLSTMLVDPDAVPNVLADALEEDWEDIYSALGIGTGQGEPEHWELVDELTYKAKAGFLVKFETPVPSDFDKHGGYIFSWGCYTSKWFYGKNYNECCNKAVKWQKSFIKSLRGK